MNYKQIETSREIRLWLGQFILPAAAVVVGILAVPEAKNAIVSKAESIKRAIINKFRKTY